MKTSELPEAENNATKLGYFWISPTNADFFVSCMILLVFVSGGRQAQIHCMVIYKE